MKEIIKKIEEKKELEEKEIFLLLEENKKQLDLLRKKDFKKANIKANESISRNLFTDYNYKIVCLKANANIESHKIAVEKASQTILKKIGWWEND